MTERELAENICKVHARTLVDEAGGISISGITMAMKFAAKWHNMDTTKCEQALIHWVLAAGYERNGEFKYIISNHILNT